MERIIPKQNVRYKPTSRRFKLGLKCVYKLIYRDGKYYIGCTCCLSTRMSSQKTYHSRGIKKKGKVYTWEDVKYVIPIKIDKNYHSLRVLENELISKNWYDKKILNMTIYPYGSSPFTVKYIEKLKRNIYANPNRKSNRKDKCHL